MRLNRTSRVLAAALALWAAPVPGAEPPAGPVFSPPGEGHRWSEDGKYLVWTQGNKVVFAEAGTWKIVREIPGRAKYISLSRDGNLLAWWDPYGGTDTPVTVYDLKEGRELWTQRAPDAGAYHEFSPDGKYFGVGEGSKKYTAWEARTGRLAADPGQVSGVAWGGPDGKYLAYCVGKMGQFKGVIVNTGTGIESPLGWTLGNWCRLAFSPDGRWAAYVQSVEGRENGRVRILELASGKFAYEGAFFYPENLLFSEDSGAAVFTALGDFHAVDLRAGWRHFSLETRDLGNIGDYLTMNADGSVLAATTGTDKLAIVERRADGLRLTHTLAVPQYYGSFSFSPDGLFYIYSAHEKPEIKLLDYRSGRWIATIDAGKNQFQSPKVSPNGEFLVLAGTGRASVWRLPQALGLRSRIAWREEEKVRLAAKIQAEKEAKLGEARVARNAGRAGELSPKGEFESNAEYEGRRRAAEAKATAAEAALEWTVKTIEEEFAARLERETLALAPEVEAFLNSDKIERPAVTLGRYDPEAETFPAEVSVGETVSFTLAVPRAEAPRVKNAGVEAEASFRYALKDGALVKEYRTLKVSDPKLGALASWNSGAPSSDAARRPDLPPSLKSEVSFRDESGDGVLDAGEKAVVAVQVSNGGPGPAFGVAVSVEPQAGTGLSYPAVSRAGDLAKGQARSVEFQIRAGLDLASGSRTLELKAADANRFTAPPVRLTFKTREFSPPRLALADFGVKDANGNGKVEPGELADLTLRIKNGGGSTARGVQLALSKSDPDLFIQGDNRRDLGDLKPGESRDAVFTVFANTQFSGTALDFSARLSEREGRYGLSAPLSVPIGRLVAALSEVIVAETGAKGQPAAPGLRVDVDEPLAQAAPERPEALAVIFGIEKYRKAPAVTYARRDAAVFRDYAVKALGVPDSKDRIFFLGEDATLGEFRKAFSKGGWLARRARPGSDVYIFVAGHGAPDLKSQDAFLIPEDGDPNYPAETGFPLQDLKDLAASLKVRSVTIFLDACFSGSDRESRPLLASARPLVHRVAPLGGSLPPQVTLLAAAREDQVSSGYPEGRHGLFSYFLLKGLRGAADADGDRTITAGELRDFVRDGVGRAAAGMDREQTPVLFGDPSRPVAVLPRSKTP